VFPDHFQFPVHVHMKLLEKTGFRVKTVLFRYGHYAKTLRHGINCTWTIFRTRAT
jgi:hypothetical protein